MPVSMRLGAGISAIIFILGVLSVLPSPGTKSLPPLEAPHAYIIFGGDMMFDRSVRQFADAHGGDYLFSCLDDVFLRADLVVANLEGPITASSSKSADSLPGDGNNYIFTFPTSTAELLYKHRVRLVSIGNNHIMNFGIGGLLQTKAALRQAGVGYFGDPDSLEPDKVARIEVGGIPFSFINWSDWTSDNTDITGAQVAKEKAAGRVVVVYAHWGEEYVPPLARVARLAHTFVDQGADIVIGSHPHIVQEHELYKGKYIYYSLGNLIFDQYWTDAVDHGLMLGVDFGKDGVEKVTEIPVELKRDRRTCPYTP